ITTSNYGGGALQSGIQVFRTAESPSRNPAANNRSNGEAAVRAYRLEPGLLLTAILNTDASLLSRIGNNEQWILELRASDHGTFGYPTVMVGIGLVGELMLVRFRRQERI
ncbi:MAG: hypothetical protein ACQETB_12520, partial [Halobacteriota archaeon]